ncbi:hypothetical protein [Aequorivita sp. KMM 9714]|uniref:tetratricopeptide repeat protein n=1 Tax=Aequorivita sp. KMM 9714 TaxID=2707173 RepID=UPI0013EC3613|nr:hypothetical protein [Aequorivita sp. KMM 9714]NGX84455.1 hypothetical protein [Aequorivita sp. KMM 9714]
MKTQIEITQVEWDMIETYLDRENDLNKHSISEEIKQIPDFEQKIEHIKKVREEIEDSIRRSKMNDFHKHVNETEDSKVKSLSSPKTKSYTMWYSAAAILILLFGIFWMLDSNNTAEKIFAENFKPDIGLPLKMGNADSYEFYEGMLDYKQENYKKAISKWEVLLKDNPENDTLNYFLGVANLALGDASESLKYLTNQERFQEGMFKEEAAYYTALAKIKEGKIEEAKNLLKNTPSIQNTKLLRQLEKE